jgi:hypothetical protein
MRLCLYCICALLAIIHLQKNTTGFVAAAFMPKQQTPPVIG